MDNNNTVMCNPSDNNMETEQAAVESAGAAAAAARDEKEEEGATKAAGDVPVKCLSPVITALSNTTKHCQQNGCEGQTELSESTSQQAQTCNENTEQLTVKGVPVLPNGNNETDTCNEEKADGTEGAVVGSSQCSEIGDSPGNLQSATSDVSVEHGNVVLMDKDSCSTVESLHTDCAKMDSVTAPLHISCDSSPVVVPGVGPGTLSPSVSAGHTAGAAVKKGPRAKMSLSPPCGMATQRPPVARKSCKGYSIIPPSIRPQIQNRTAPSRHFLDTVTLPPGMQDEEYAFQSVNCPEDENVPPGHAPSPRDPTKELRAKSVPKARKSFPAKNRQSRSEDREADVMPLIASMTFKLPEIENALGIKRKMLDKMDAKTLDNFVLQKVKKSRVSSMHGKTEPAVVESQSVKLIPEVVSDDGYTSKTNSCEVNFASVITGQKLLNKKKKKKKKFASRLGRYKLPGEKKHPKKHGPTRNNRFKNKNKTALSAHRAKQELGKLGRWRSERLHEGMDVSDLDSEASLSMASSKIDSVTLSSGAASCSSSFSSSSSTASQLRHSNKFMPCSPQKLSLLAWQRIPQSQSASLADQAVSDSVTGLSPSKLQKPRKKKRPKPKSKKRSRWAQGEVLSWKKREMLRMKRREKKEAEERARMEQQQDEQLQQPSAKKATVQGTIPLLFRKQVAKASPSAQVSGMINSESTGD